MKAKLAVVFLSLSLAATAAAQGDQPKAEVKSPARKLNSITGKWRGEIDKRPAVELLLKADGDKLAGTIVFFPISPNGDESAAAEREELPLVEPNFDGSTLSCKLKRPDGAVTKFKMKLTGAGEAVLKPADDPNVTEEMEPKLKRVE